MKLDYDIIICGAGCAGLSLAYRLSTDAFKHLDILIIDPDTKDQNDRTWCFWEKEAGIFESIVKKSWQHVHFHSPSVSKVLDFGRYSYKMIEGIDFYNHVKSRISKSLNISWCHETVTSLNEINDQVLVTTTNHTFNSKKCFKNYLDVAPDKSHKWYVDQHFGGWVIKSKTACFDPNKATFMDFRIEQNGEARFFYILPTSETKALVEIAIFSNNKWSRSDYDQQIKDYIASYVKTTDYEVLDTEYGVIPMTSYDFTQNAKSSRIIPVGTAAGAVKASSGYAFYRIQQQCDYIIDCLQKDVMIKPYFKPNRFSFYDRIMLNVILTGKVPATQIFSMLFDKLKPEQVLAFLNEEISFPKEIAIFTAPPWWPFTKAMLEELKN